MSDNKNNATTDRTELLDEITISVRRIKEYARSKGGTHNIIVTLRIAQLLGEGEKNNEERLGNKRKKKELSAHQVHEAEEK